MTAAAQPSPHARVAMPDHLLTIVEYAALGETESGYTELVEGRLLMSPSPAPIHNIASLELAIQLRSQLPGHLRAVQDIDIDLELLPPGQRTTGSRTSNHPSHCWPATWRVNSATRIAQQR